MLENAGADKCVLMLNQGHQWQVRVVADLKQTSLQNVPLENNALLPLKVIQYVKNTLETLVINDSKTDLPLVDRYLEQYRPKSVLCFPILDRGKLVGILYLENRSTSGVFTQERLLVLNFLCTQAAISLENARLYQISQDYAQQLEKSQLQIVQSEKMASLGNLVAGVAHEINNPLGFLNGSLNNARDYLQDLLGHVELYQQEIPNAPQSIRDNAEDIDLEYVGNDFPKVLSSMQGALERLKAISTSLRTFSRADSETPVRANLHEGLDSTLLILKYRLKANDKRPAIAVVKDYGNLPEIECFHGQLNQVFMNILANAIDALDEVARDRTYGELESHPQTIEIQTRVVADGTAVEICLRDNGPGIPQELQSRIFDHLFTTKGVGKGTGLGLAIARQIVVEKHGGALEARSPRNPGNGAQIGEGTEFCIQLPLAYRYENSDRVETQL